MLPRLLHSCNCLRSDLWQCRCHHSQHGIHSSLRNDAYARAGMWPKLTVCRVETLPWKAEKQRLTETSQTGPFRCNSKLKVYGARVIVVWRQCGSNFAFSYSRCNFCRPFPKSSSSPAARWSCTIWCSRPQTAHREFPFLYQFTKSFLSPMLLYLLPHLNATAMGKKKMYLKGFW